MDDHLIYTNAMEPLWPPVSVPWLEPEDGKHFEYYLAFLREQLNEWTVQQMDWSIEE